MNFVRTSDAKGLPTEGPVQSNSFARTARRRNLRSRLWSELLKVWLATAIIGALFVFMALGGTMTSWGMQISTHAGVGAVLVSLALGALMSVVPILHYGIGVRHLRDQRQINHNRDFPYP